MLTNCGLDQLTDGKAWDLVREFMDKIPECPECKRKTCPVWYKRYFNWLMTVMLGPDGFMEMFIATLNRQGGRAIFTVEELMYARLVKKVEREKSDDDLFVQAYVKEREQVIPNKLAEQVQDKLKDREFEIPIDDEFIM